MPSARKKTRKSVGETGEPEPKLLADALESLGDGVLLLANVPGRGGLPIVHANAAFAAMP